VGAKRAFGLWAIVLGTLALMRIRRRIASWERRSGKAGTTSAR
jgi:hypothetical protein